MCTFYVVPPLTYSSNNVWRKPEPPSSRAVQIAVDRAVTTAPVRYRRSLVPQLEEPNFWSEYDDSPASRQSQILLDFAVSVFWSLTTPLLTQVDDFDSFKAAISLDSGTGSRLGDVGEL